MSLCCEAYSLFVMSSTGNHSGLTLEVLCPPFFPGLLTSQKRPFSQHCTTTCDFDKYIVIITFWRETSPPGNKGSSQNIRWFLKAHYNQKLKINITAKRSYQLKIIKFFFWPQGFWVGGDTGGIFLFELKYVMTFRNTGFNSFIHSFIYYFFNLFLAKMRSGF